MDNVSSKENMDVTAAERKRELRKQLKKRTSSLTEEYKKDADRQIFRRSNAFFLTENGWGFPDVSEKELWKYA